MLKINKENMTIHKSTICRMLNKELGRPRKVKRVFFLTDDQKRQRIEFCEKMLKKGIKGGNIFFSDETKIDIGSYFNDYTIDQTNEELAKQYFFNSYVFQNNSPILSSLYGITKITTKCLKCNCIKYNFQSYTLLYFPLREAKKHIINIKKS